MPHYFKILRKIVASDREHSILILVNQKQFWGQYFVQTAEEKLINFLSDFLSFIVKRYSFQLANCSLEHLLN